MKSVGGLFSNLVSLRALQRAMHRAACGKKDRPGVRRFLLAADRELPALRTELMTERYRPLPYHQFGICDPKPRLISCADFRDRVVHHAVCEQLAPAIERRLVDNTYACRRGKGSHRAVLRAQRLSRRYRYYMKTDKLVPGGPGRVLCCIASGHPENGGIRCLQKCRLLKTFRKWLLQYVVMMRQFLHITGVM